jgi:hypothetical protein
MSLWNNDNLFFSDINVMYSIDLGIVTAEKDLCTTFGDVSPVSSLTHHTVSVETGRVDIGLGKANINHVSHIINGNACQTDSCPE